MLQHLLRARDAPAVVVLTASENEEDLLEAVRLGARGIVLKAMAPKTIERCIRAVYEGREWLTVEGQDLAARLAQRQRVEAELAERLTPRELEIVRNLAGQLDNDEIARNLKLSVGTVKIHLHHIYTKLGVTWARRTSEVPEEEGLLSRILASAESRQNCNHDDKNEMNGKLNKKTSCGIASISGPHPCARPDDRDGLFLASSTLCHESDDS